MTEKSSPDFFSPARASPLIFMSTRLYTGFFSSMEFTPSGLVTQAF